MQVVSQSKRCSNNFKDIFTVTLPETNMGSEHRLLEREIPIGNHHFQVNNVIFREGSHMFIYRFKVLKKKQPSWIETPRLLRRTQFNREQADGRNTWGVQWQHDLYTVLLMEEIRLTSWYGESTTIYRVLPISGGAGFLPSTVWIPRCAVHVWICSTWKVKNGHIFTRGNGHRWTFHPMEHILLWTFHFGRDSDASVRMVSIHPLTFIGLILNNPDCWEVLVYIYIYLYGVALIIRLFQHTFFSHTPSNCYQQAIQSIQGSLLGGSSQLVSG